MTDLIAAYEVANPPTIESPEVLRELLVACLADPTVWVSEVCDGADYLDLKLNRDEVRMLVAALPVKVPKPLTFGALPSDGDDTMEVAYESAAPAVQSFAQSGPNVQSPSDSGAHEDMPLTLAGSPKQSP